MVIERKLRRERSQSWSSPLQDVALSPELLGRNEHESDGFKSAEEFIDSIEKKYLKKDMSNEQKFEFIRNSILSRRGFINQKPIFSNDWTASGQSMSFVNEILQQFQVFYANTHSQDNFTADFATQAYHEMIDRVKKMAKLRNGFLIPCGAGATEAFHRLQEILGLFIAPATRAKLNEMFPLDLPEEFKESDLEKFPELPVILVGPYEHHSNDVALRKCFAVVIHVAVVSDPQHPDFTGIDYVDLENKLKKYSDMKKKIYGFFSAGSNITGLKTDVKRLVTTLHKYKAKAILDYAALFPYAKIDMSDSGADAIVIATHKSIPDTPGLILARNSLYRLDLSPTMCGGGTVTFVSESQSEFHKDIEAREQAGSPNGQGMLKALIAFMIRNWIGYDVIEKKEEELNHFMMPLLTEHPNVLLLGHPSPSLRVSIYSMCIKFGPDRFLHPKFVSRLLSDRFGVQTRPGCSCAAVYGKFLLGIEDEKMRGFRVLLADNDLELARPGWVRFGFHWSDDDHDLAHTKFAINTVSWFGHLFLEDYLFDISNVSFFQSETQEVKRTIIDNPRIREKVRKEGAKKMRKEFVKNIVTKLGALLTRILKKPENKHEKLDSYLVKFEDRLKQKLNKNDFLFKFLCCQLDKLEDLKENEKIFTEKIRKVLKKLIGPLYNKEKVEKLITTYVDKMFGCATIRDENLEYFDETQPYTPYVVWKTGIFNLEKHLRGKKFFEKQKCNLTICQK